MDVQPLVETGGYTVILGLVVWLIRRVFTHTIPRLAEDFKESLAKQQQTFSEQLSMQREDFKEALNLQREDFKFMLQHGRCELEGKLDHLSQVIERAIEKEVQ